MTISTTYAPVQYTGNAVTTAFSFPYPFFDDTDLLVNLDGVLQASGYTITGGSGASGTVTFTTAPASGVVVTLSLSLPYTQLDDYVENQAFPADTLEYGLDRAALRDQQLFSLVNRAVKYPDTVSGITNAVLPEPVDGAALIFSGTDGEITTSETYIADAIADATAGVTGTSLITATSTTSLATTGTGNKTWVIQSGRGFAMGQRLRVSSDDGTKINEGRVVSYSGTSLVINVDYVSGTGTHADWNISVTGDRGATGGGTGDMLGAQNLNDVADKPTAFNTIKQAATDSNSGVVELATDAETIAGTDTQRAITPANLRAASPFIKSFTSSDQSITSGGLLTLAHSLGASPAFVQLELVCQTGELGWTAGNVTPINVSIMSGSASNSGSAVYWDSTNVYIRIGSNSGSSYDIIRKDTGARSGITNTNWKLRVKAFA